MTRGAGEGEPAGSLPPETDRRTQDESGRNNSDQPPPGDGWSVIAYLLAGLIVYGGIGWGLDQWFGTTLLMPFGLIAGGVASVYLLYMRYVKS